MTEPKFTICDTMPELDPYHRDTGQETWTELWIDLETGKYGISQEYDDNSTPIEVWHGRQISYKVQDRPDQEAAHAYLTGDAVDLIQTILDGASIDWDGSNMVGGLNPTAQAALEDLCEAVDCLPGSDWTLWRMDDYLAPANIVIDENTTNAEILALVADIQADIDYQHVVLTDDIADYLYSEREAETGRHLTTAEAARLIGVTPAHLRRMLIAGEVRGQKRGRDWTIDAEDIRGITPRRKR